MNQEQFYQWFQEIRGRFYSLKKWQAYGLALISYGVMKARKSQASLIAEELPQFGKASTVERRIQRWIANPRIQISAASRHWARWVLDQYQGRVVYLLVDETKLRDRIACMMISLAFQKRAIPLTWRCYRANSSSDYPQEGQVQMICDLLKRIHDILPANCQIILQADRGIGHSSNLMRAVQEMGIDFLFRVRWEAVFETREGKRASLAALAKRGEEWHGSGTLFTQHRSVDCHLHLLWVEKQDEPWCLATSLEGISGHEYAHRVWQEESFRDLKSGGWQWHKNLSRNPDTLERLLLPMVIAYALCITLGNRFQELDESIRRKIDYVRKHPKYGVFRLGLRYFKRMFFLEQYQISFQIGPFHAPA